MTGFRPRQALGDLARAGVEFVVVGGIAAAMRGSLRATTDLDVLVRSSPENFRRLATVLTQFAARVKGSTRVPVPIEPSLLEGMNLVTFDTELGELDVLSLGIGGWTYERVVDHAEEVEVAGVAVLLISVDDLIAMKRAAGRPKDLETADELEALQALESRLAGGGPLNVDLDAS